MFALVGLPEVVKGALFARYSRSPKSLRRLLIDEFLPGGDGGPARGPVEGPGEDRAEALYGRVLAEYGDDSVAQLGGAHIAVEGASNLLTKILQWGRLASYLEQSTRYIAFTDRPGGRYRYHRPDDVMSHPGLGPDYVATLDAAFDGYARLLPRLVEHVGAGVPDDPGTPPAARERAVRARALDLLRGLLPAATTANVGIYASGQAYEAMLIRMAAHPLPEARECARSMLAELRTVIPAFLTRVDRVDRGVATGEYLAEGERTAAALGERLGLDPPSGAEEPGVRLIDFDPDGEARVLAHALWPSSGGSLADLRGARRGPHARPARRGAARVGRAARRPAPAPRARAGGDDVHLRGGLRLRRLPRPAAPPHADAPGPAARAAARVHDPRRGGRRRRRATTTPRIQGRCVALHDALAPEFAAAAPYAVTLAHRIRFTMTLNAREAMHLIELRSQPQGHESYRVVAREMHREIAETAGHRALAEMMTFVDTSEPGAGRMAAERRLEARRAGR